MFPVTVLQSRFRAYFGSLRAGYPVARIEEDLGLVPSTDRWAPTLHPYRPFWRVLYWQYGLCISFDADDVSPTAHGAKLMYAGDPSVVTDEEYRESLLRMGVLP